MSNLFDGWILLIGSLVAAYTLFAPYTKVEESFNVQAVHDLIYHGTNLDLYDHIEFPGVVPRTFLGPVFLAAATLPIKAVLAFVGLPKALTQVAFRLVLGAAGILAFAHFKRAAGSVFGPSVATCFAFLTATQFHIPFYMSRPLPNVLATAITTWGLADWVRGRHPRRALALLTIASVVFRCDAIMLVGLVGLHMLATRQVSLLSGVAVGAGAAAVGLAVSVTVDSFFWRRLLWPEGEVLWFNTVMNKSHEWGVSPPFWYFTSALPRGLHAAYPLSFIGAAIEKRVRPAFLIGLGFIALYSNLGHKELRFLFPALPLLNLSAAAALSRIWSSRRRSCTYNAIFLASAAAIAAGVGITVLGVVASSQNYPGGVALKALHMRAAQEARHATSKGQSLAVHIDVLPAMTGVSRFGEAGAPWVYSKEEGLSQMDLSRAGFDYLLSSQPLVSGYELIDAIPGFKTMRFVSRSPKKALVEVLQGRSPISLVTAPAVYIHQRQPQAV